MSGTCGRLEDLNLASSDSNVSGLRDEVDSSSVSSLDVSRLLEETGDMREVNRLVRGAQELLMEIREEYPSLSSSSESHESDTDSGNSEVLWGNYQVYQDQRLSLRREQVPITFGNSSLDDSDEEIRRVRRQLYLLSDSNEDWSDPPFDTTSIDTSISSRSDIAYLNEGYIDDMVIMQFNQRDEVEDVSVRARGNVEESEDCDRVEEQDIADRSSIEDQENLNESSTEDQVEDLESREGVSHGNDVGGGNLSFVGIVSIDPTVGLGPDEGVDDLFQVSDVGGDEERGLEEASTVVDGEKSTIDDAC